MPSAEGAFPRTARLLKPDDFRRVFSGGERSSDQLFLVIAKPNNLHCARLGLAISKRKTPRAVDRNRLKRLVRESFRRNQGLLSGLDLVVLNRGDVMLTDNKFYQDSLLTHWRKLAQKCNVS